MNDSPEDCQNHGVTEPQREGTALAVERYINIDKYYVFIYIYPKKNLSVTLRWQLPLGKGALYSLTTKLTDKLQFVGMIEILKYWWIVSAPTT